jgi:hypothetical protein
MHTHTHPAPYLVLVNDDLRNKYSLLQTNKQTNKQMSSPTTKKVTHSKYVEDTDDIDFPVQTTKRSKDEDANDDDRLQRMSAAMKTIIEVRISLSCNMFHD